MTVELSPKAVNLIRRALLVYVQDCPSKYVETVNQLIDQFIQLEESETK